MDRPSIAVVLLADEKPDVSMSLDEWHLEEYDKVIVASRECRPAALLDRVRRINPRLEYRPLDGEEVFERAKLAYLNSVADFRKWFCSRLTGPKDVWWLTSASFAHDSDPLFGLFLCVEFQNMMKDEFPCSSMRCEVITREVCAYLFNWPLPTAVGCSHRKSTAMARLLLWDLYAFAVNFVSRLVHALTTRRAAWWVKPVDVCLIAFGGWEKRDGQLRDRHYTDLPQHLGDSGFSVRVVCPQDDLRSLGRPQSGLDGVIQCGPRSTLLAGCRTARFILHSALGAIRCLCNWDERGKWLTKIFMFRLLTGNRSLFSNLVKAFGFGEFFYQNPTKAIIMYTELYFHGRALQLGLSRLPCSARPITIGFQHGFISESKIAYMPDKGDATMPFPTCDYYFAYNELAARVYGRLLNGERRNRVRIVGMHRISPAAGGRLRHDPRTVLLDNCDLTRPVFLLIGSTPERMEDAWTAICAQSRSAAIQVIIKPHPDYALSAEWLGRFDTEHGSHLWHDKDYDLDWAVSVSDYVMVHASTAVLNVIAQKKQIILLALDGRFDLYRLQPWLESNSQVGIARSGKQLEEILVASATRKPFDKASHIGSDAYLPPYFGKNCVDAMCREVRQIIRGSTITD